MPGPATETGRSPNRRAPVTCSHSASGWKVPSSLLMGMPTWPLPPTSAVALTLQVRPSRGLRSGTVSEDPDAQASQGPFPR